MSSSVVDGVLGCLSFRWFLEEAADFLAKELRDWRQDSNPGGGVEDGGSWVVGMVRLDLYENGNHPSPDFFFFLGGDSKVDAFLVSLEGSWLVQFFFKTSLTETEGKHLTRWAIKRTFPFPTINFQLVGSFRDHQNTLPKTNSSHLTRWSSQKINFKGLS